MVEMAPLGDGTYVAVISNEQAAALAPMTVGRIRGVQIVRAGGRNRHERRANEARRRKGLPVTVPDEVIHHG